MTATESRIISTTGRRGGTTASGQSAFAEISSAIKQEGLLRRRRGFYVMVFACWSLALIAAITAMLVIGDSWWQLAVAVALGVIFTQFAFLAHEAAHRQIFASGKANERAGLVLGNLVVGLSYAWWMNKHSRHHANPNTVGKDPDIEKDTISFLEEDAAASRGLVRLITRKQGYLFFPLLLLEGVNLHRHAFVSAFGRGRVAHRSLEIALLLLRFSAYFALLFVLLPVPIAVVFIAVQMAVFGLYMGASFAPNHKGMPIIARNVRVDFLRRQVLTSRNIAGGAFVDIFMGGLNYQVEHHLFPSMPRPALRRTQRLVKAYCLENNVHYTETTLLNSYAIVIRYLNRVGLAAGDPFECPMVSQYRPRD
ncbi:fatty acid desaturase family protein [Rathayibacter sp. CAU 1779]